MPWITAPAAWLRASTGAAILPIARPVCALSTRTWPSQVSTSTSITCTELGTPAPTTMFENRRSIQPKIMPMRPTSLNGERMPGAVFASSAVGRDGEVGRRRDQVAPGRIGARRRRPRGAGARSRPSVLHREQRRRHHRGGDAAAAGAGSFGQVEWPIRTSMSSGSRPNSRATVLAITVRVPVPISCTAVLATMRPPLMASSTLRSGLPEIEPVSGGDADAAAEAAVLRCRRFAVAPDVETGRPVVKPLPVGIGIPALAQDDRIELQPQRGLIDRLLQRKGHRRTAGAAKRRAGRQIADDVEIGKLLGLRRIDQARQRRDVELVAAPVSAWAVSDSALSGPRATGSSASFSSAAGR